MIRPSKDKLKAMKEREEKQSAALAEFKTLVEGFDGKFWEKFKARLLSKADEFKTVRDANFYKWSELDLKLSRREEDTLRFVAQIPLDIVSSYESLVKQNAQLREEIRDYGRRLNKGL